MIKNKRRLRVSLAIAVGFFLVNLVFVLCHEQFYDEANTWQIAKELTPMNFVDVFGLEPHPLLWTILIAPFAKLGFAIIAQNIISLLVMTLAVFVLVRYAPFKMYAKILLVISGAFMLYFPVIARDYCLVVLGLALVAATYKERVKRPIWHLLSLVVLYQAHFLAFPIATVIACYFLYDLKKNGQKIAPYVIWLVLCMMTVLLCVVGPLMGHGVIQQSDRNVMVDVFAYFEGVNVSLFGVVFPVFEVIMLVTMILVLLKCRTRVLVILLTGCVVQSLVLLLLYRDYYSVLKNALLLHYIVFSVWIAAVDGAVKRRRIIDVALWSELVKVFYNNMTLGAVLVVMAITTIPRLIACGIYEVREDYDLSHELAAYINELPDGVRVVTLNDDVMAVAAVPFLEGDRALWSLIDEAEYWYFKLGSDKKQKKSAIEIREELSRNFPGQSSIYMLFTNTYDLVDGVEIVREFKLNLGPKFYNAEEHYYMAKIK